MGRLPNLIRGHMYFNLIQFHFMRVFLKILFESVNGTRLRMEPELKPLKTFGTET